MKHLLESALTTLEGGGVLEWLDSVCNKSPYRQLVHSLCGVVHRPCMIKIVNILPVLSESIDSLHCSPFPRSTLDDK